MAFLEAFPARLQKNALKSAMIAGARVVRDEARANVPVKSGKLRKAIKTSSPRAFKGGAASVKVKVLGEHSFIGHFIEYGVRPHLITAGDSKLTVRTLNKRASRGEGIRETETGLIRVGGYEGTRTTQTSDGPREDTFKINAAFIRGAIVHPGFPAHPFLRPALDRTASQVVDAIGSRLREYLKDRTSFTAPITIEADVEDE
ncbi:Phage protein, HK97, gp10 [Novosphingobium aromaticivorans DSM 12444]|uniref:Phage protein, HK97, gp10 n=2 Tax=Novosphingobium aromaticivorans TaxID=48935 RepID=Q2GAM2_NOVAD|nr:Phage protein, HK97, gp10 [Novosphingobium aromaticivorans DSM 12444]SCY95827.1 phage protein, HK97 gp10 family [Novosphingobium aromaticivorans]